VSLFVRVALVALSWELYAGLFLQLYAESGRGVAAVAGLPVALSAALFGTRIGLLSALGSVPLGILLAEMSGTAAPEYVGVGWGIGTVVLHGVAALVGSMRAMNIRLRHELVRRNTTLRFARLAAAESSPERLLVSLAEEACLLLGAESGVVLREPIATADGRGSVSVPLRHEGRVFGVLSLRGRRGARPFPSEDVEVLEVLAATAAAALVGMELTRLEGALLAVRTAQHGIRNALTAAIACAEIVADDPDVPEALRQLGQEAVRGTLRANAELEQLGQLSRIEEYDWGPNAEPTIDLERSALVR
jgi:hypothetical protein